MRRLAAKHGFVECVAIHVRDGLSRIAYERLKDVR